MTSESNNYQEFSPFYRLQNDVVQNIDSENYNASLEKIRDFVQYVMNEHYPPGELIGSRKLDDLCARLGMSFYRKHYEKIKYKDLFLKNSDVTVIICTGLFKSGGSSPLIGDIVRAQGDRKCMILATNSLESMSPDDLAMSRLGTINAAITVCPSGTLEHRLHWLIQQLTRLEPSRIILLNHHQDSVIIAGAAPFASKADVIFYHHADHNLCLGVHLKGAIHVDIHNVGYCNCREKEQILNNFYVPMTVNDLGINYVRKDFMRKGRLTTCGSGSPHKVSNFYLYSYYDLVIERLKRREGSHIHIGALPDAILNHLHRRLRSDGIDASRLVNISWTESLWKSFIENHVDLFIGSFPIGGARTAIEAMGAGLPMLMHESYLTRFHSSRDIAYPDHYVWQYPHEFYSIIETIDKGALREHSARSRAYYLEYHCKENLNLENELNRICERTSTAKPAPLYPHNPDMLDRSLHFAHLEDIMNEHAVQHVRALYGAGKKGLLRQAMTFANVTSKPIRRTTVRTYRKARLILPWSAR